jgi:hypothetical protein
MTLKEYLDLKATGYFHDEFNQEITVINKEGTQVKIQLGALKSFLDDGYSVADTSNLS